jgi:hypothetical protein
MMGWDWCLRTADCTCIFFVPGLFFDVDYDRMVFTEANSQLVYLSTLAATSTLWWSCQQGHLWSEWESGWRKWELNLYVPLRLKEIFTCHKILWHGTSGFTFHPKEGVLQIFIALAGLEPAAFWSSGKHTNHYTSKVTSGVVTIPGYM